MTQAAANGIVLEYEISGPPGGSPLLLIHGVGAQLIRWPQPLCDGLAAAGFRVIRYDSRDIGLSTHMDGAPIPDFAVVAAAQRRGEMPALPYTLNDLADDAAALLTSLGIHQAHVLGVSLGGMVAQVLAIEHRPRVLSLNILMSHAANPDMPPSDPAALAKLAAIPPDPVRDRQAYLRHSLELNTALGSPDYPTPPAALRDHALRSLERAYHPMGAARQLAAGRGAPDRRAALRSLAVPTLVIHGAADVIIPLAGGQDIATNVKGAWWLAINGMGHDLPAELCGIFVAAIKANSARLQGGV